MDKSNFIKGGFTGAAIVIGLLVLLFFALPEIYLRTENHNFAKMREKSKLNCQTMPLHCLSRDENIEAISEYGNRGQDTELKDNWGRTALHWSLSNDKPSIIFTKLLAAGADANTKDENKQSIFFRAVAMGKYDVADQLLENKADIDAFNGSQYPETALHFCVIKNKLNCVEYLIRRGANKNLKDSFGYTVYERIQMHNHIDKKIGKILEK